MDLQRKKVLIIDDEEDICFLLSALLRKKNFEIKIVNTIHDGIAAVENQQPDLIFLDNHLPDGMGINNVEKIKAVSPRSKIIMITAYDTMLDRSAALKKGVDVFVGKPFNGERIYGAVDEAAGNV